MSRPFDICVRGAGIVGRAMALQLAAKRLRVALVDAPAQATSDSTPGHSDVRAYALSPASRALLESLRCWPDAAFATPVKAMEVAGDDGGLLHFEAAGQGSAALNWMVDVAALEGRLAQAVEFQGLIERVDAPRPAPLTVVCEGRASASRAGWGLVYDQKPYGQHALATRVRSERPHGEIARQWFNREGAATEVLALLPLDGPLGSACAVVWSVSPDRAQALRDMDGSQFDAALDAASHGALGALQACAERQTWPLQFALAQHWSGAMPATDGVPGSAWVLAGDAAHTVHPLAGQGLNLGLGDVAALARILDERPYWRPLSDAKILRAYERERKTAFALVGHTTDALQRLFDHPHPLVAQARNWGLRGFDRSAGLKHWVTRQAMGLA
jgi:2-polyprenyl-6-methoxyphenol hydroxylase-like FAD-dependent oxidoreductase